MGCPYRPLEKGENEGKLRQAARAGDAVALERLEEARRVNNSDRNAHREALGKNKGSAPSPAPSSPAPKKDSLQRDIDRAAKGGTNAVYTKRLRERARKAGRPIPEGEGSFKKYPAETSSAASDTSTPAKLSHREKNDLRRKASQGDAKALGRLRQFGKARSLDEQNYQNAANSHRDNRLPEGRWAASVRPSSKDASSVVNDILDSTPAAIPESRREWVAKKAEHTYVDLVSRGTDPNVARRVAQSYADKFAEKHQDPNEKAFLENWNKKRNQGQGK